MKLECFSIIFVASIAASVSLEDVTLIEFDGKDKNTNFEWTAENDPVMGGLSTSTFTQKDGIGIMNGTVAIVPSLKAPGFCFPHTVGVRHFNDASQHTHLGLLIRTSTPEYQGFKVSFAADTLNPQFSSFKADFRIPSSGDGSEFQKVLIPFNEFSNKWSPATGEPEKKCSEDSSVCPTEHNKKDIYQFGIWAEGAAGDFHVEIQRVFATSPSATVEKGSDIPLATFDGAAGTSFDWETVDDPVMGGRSHSMIDLESGEARWHGTVAIVPFLKAPGFCTIRTSDAKAKFNDVRGTQNFKMMARNAKNSTITKFSLSLETKGGRNMFKQGTYEGEVTVPATGEWIEVKANWQSFNLTWRGERIKGPAIETQLGEIEQVGLTTYFPGPAGNFSLEIKSMSAGN